MKTFLAIAIITFLFIGISSLIVWGLFSLFVWFGAPKWVALMVAVSILFLGAGLKK